MHSTSRRARLRTALAVLGAATVLVGGIQLVATAATGGPLLLGKTNTSDKTTKLKTTGKKPALQLKAKAGKPALAVSSKALIKNLNADFIDGKSLEQLTPTIYRLSMFTPGGLVPGSPVAAASTALPAGTYRASVTGLFSIGSAEEVTCQFVDYTTFQASGGTDLTAILLTGRAMENLPSLHDARVVTIVAGRQYLFACSGTAGIEVAQPAEFLLESGGQSTAMPGVAPFTPRSSLLERAESLG